MNEIYRRRKKTLPEILSLFKPGDHLAIPLGTGVPLALMNSLSERTDWERLDIFCGLLPFPFPILQNTKVHLVSGYYGPIERFLNEEGAHVAYLPANFTGFEIYAKKTRPRVVATTLSPPDAEGYLTFGTHGAAVYRPFLEACRDPNRVAIAEVNPTMPVVYGAEEFGDNKIHISELQSFFEADQSQIEVPPLEVTETEKRIAENVIGLISGGDTLQFGIGGIPNAIAALLAGSSLSDFGIHSELVSDGFLRLVEAGKISNRNKGIFPNQSVFTFAFGSQALYDFLDERKGRNKRQAICLPVSVVNDPAVIARHSNMVSVNSGLAIDFAGQVCSEAIGLRQYSGVGGQLSFVEGAYHAENGKSVICIKSTATLGDKRVSNIVSTLPAGSIVSTPRHFTQYVVTEYGVANLYGVSDERRGEKLIAIAHPDFRELLMEEYEKIRTTYYKN